MRNLTSEELRLSEIIHDKTRPEKEREEAKKKLKELWEANKFPAFA